MELGIDEFVSSSNLNYFLNYRLNDILKHDYTATLDDYFKIRLRTTGFT